MAIPKSSSRPTIERFVAEHEAKLIWHRTFINIKNLEYNTDVNPSKFNS